MGQFDEKTKEIYRSIKAPDSLRERVLKNDTEFSKQSKGKIVNLKAVKRTLSLCAALAIIMVAFITHSFLTPTLSVSKSEVGNTPILLSDFLSKDNEISMARTVDSFQLPMSLTSHGNAKVQVSAGRLISDIQPTDSTEKELNFSGNLNLIWEINPAEIGDGAVLTITSFLQTERFTLFCNENGKMYFAKEK